MHKEIRKSPRHPIRVVARRTGLTPAVLRAWEKRYGAVVPSRTEGGQRFYSDEDVLRLSLLHRVVEEGRSISQVASTATEELLALAKEDEAGRKDLGAPEPLGGTSAARILEEAKRAVEGMDTVGLERVLTRGAMAFPVSTVIDDLVVPLLAGIGTDWESGQIGPAHEHLATAAIRRFSEWMLGKVDVGNGAPAVVAATPVGERHELGALLSAVSGAAEGWKGVFLGPDLPAEEIVSAAFRLEAEVVALSCLDFRTAEDLPGEVKQLREQLSSDVHLVLGGPLAISYEEMLVGKDVEVLPTLQEFRSKLRDLGGSRR